MVFVPSVIFINIIILIFAFLPGAPADLPKPAALKGTTLGLSLGVDAPKDVVAFTHARLVTMNGEEVIEDGTLVVEGDSIAALGKNVAVPANARVIDASGKTIVPGYIDVHAHANHFTSGVVPQENWAYYTNLAFGITTMHDPSATTETVFSQAELVKAGDMVGPRVMSTGTILYGADGDFKAVVNSLDDARAHLKRMKANGAFSVKSYTVDKEAVLERRAGYSWPAATNTNTGEAYLDTVTFKIIPEAGNRTGSLQSGQIDATAAISAADITLFNGNGFWNETRARRLRLTITILQDYSNYF